MCVQAYKLSFAGKGPPPIRDWLVRNRHASWVPLDNETAIKVNLLDGFETGEPNGVTIPSSLPDSYCQRRLAAKR